MRDTWPVTEKDTCRHDKRGGPHSPLECDFVTAYVFGFGCDMNLLLMVVRLTRRWSTFLRGHDV